MKKDRNSFFSEYNMSAYNNSNMQPMMPQMYPNQVASQSSFYSGPILDQNMMYNQNNMNNMTGMNNTSNTYTSDIESRISKIERQINRIESRLNKLEGELPYNSLKDTQDSSYSNNLYMV